MKRLKWPQSEVELGRILVPWLRAQRWIVYQEVDHADIVATQSGVVWVIEMKRSMSLKLLDQAYRWIARAHFVSIAVPMFLVSPFVGHILRGNGIGLLSLSQEGTVKEKIRPDLHRAVNTNWIYKLVPQQQDYCEAGSACGGAWTPFKETCRDVAQVVLDNPGISLKELFQKAKHHYSSAATARSCIAKWIEAGEVRGVKLVRTGKAINLYPAS